MKTIRNGARLDALASALINGSVSVTDIPTIQAVFYEGNLFALDNRAFASIWTSGHGREKTYGYEI